MSWLSWRPFGRKSGEEAPEKEAGRGELTGCDLSGTRALVRPFARDPFYRLRPPFSPSAAQMSLELAHSAYTLELDAWKEAGWNDFSILIDDSLQSGMDHDGVRSHFKLFKAKAAQKEYSLFSQLAGALRQRERSDTIKALCMMRPDGEGHFVLAIGFMGTGTRFYDWISNFRFTPEDGFHRGFSQLCESFEMNAEDIVFPAAAEALGLEKLTLGEVFGSMRSLSSPFRLWMAGHSQGGAVMQLLAHRLMTGWGVLPQNIAGYGFASPTVATWRFVYDPAAYPLYHILNGDDPVTRMGALLHLGLCLEYQPDDAFREKVYGLSGQEEAAALGFRFFTEGMRDMPAVLLSMTAMLQVLAEEKGAEGMNELMTSWWAVPAVDRMLWRAGDKVLDVLSRFLESAQEAHLALTGQGMDEKKLRSLRERIRPLVRETSVRTLAEAVAALGAAPHKLAGAYAAIIDEKTDELQPFIWVKASAGLPARRYGSWTDAGTWPQAAAPAAAPRRARAAVPAPKGRMRVSYSARRSR